MVTPSRRLLFCLAVSGWFGTAACAQEELFFTPASEPAPAPATEFTPPATIVSEPAAVVADPAPPATSIEPIPDTGTGIVRISDCPPGSGPYGTTERKKCEPPTTGWYPPGRYIMHRHWVPYYKFFPNSWTGQPTPVPQVRLPMVYMPTDTTQLGYYYQHVPHWHAYQGMTPPVPRPVDWHVKYQPTPTVAPVQYRVAPKEDLGEPAEIPMEQPAPPPPVQDLNNSASSPELLPAPL
jgi:hypothetical protein